MANIQEVFGRLQEKKHQQREIMKAYREALKNSAQYQELSEEIRKLKDKKVVIEKSLQEQKSKLEELKAEIANDNETLSDIALTKYLRGERIDLKDESDREYEPVFSVRFRKIA